ncbi:polyketide beta-ketoacyl:ACP synthase [Streptomyces sp. NBC_00441]|uniref:beta-ketoacyl synthase N-terminal-like domain-containing protein n=1 Tax=Streptomyces sp. NBC_00441 TaxID=2975742 RepID=UPI002E2C36A0|nr:beta-ketoacyl synthase N-terminal-like domain-containing protein [Streptomyces sp. NBC_00441]
MNVAISGAAVLTPLAEELDTFLAALLEGRSAVSVGGADGAGETERSLPVARLGEFRAAEWALRHLDGLPRTVASLRHVVGRAAAPAQTAACVALKAVLDAGLPMAEDRGDDRRFWGRRAAVLVAGSQLALAHQAKTALAHHRAPAGLRASYALTHMDVDVIGAVSELLGVRGEGCVVGGASASGSLALIHGARMVSAGWADHVVVVAPVAELSAVEVEAFRRSGALAHEGFPDAPERMCRPFDEERRGFVRGEGAAAVVLEPARAVRARGGEVTAEIIGHGQRLDARRGTAPSSAGQVEAMQAALASAGLRPDEVDYVNAHGTGSVLGDETEAASLLEVFGEATGVSRPAINSSKPLIGHCLSAAGLLEAVATVLQMRAGVCHPNPNLDKPFEPRLPLVGRTRERRPLRTALSNSFAFGGINASLAFRA